MVWFPGVPLLQLQQLAVLLYQVLLSADQGPVVVMVVADPKLETGPEAEHSGSELAFFAERSTEHFH